MELNRFKFYFYNRKIAIGVVKDKRDKVEA